MYISYTSLMLGRAPQGARGLKCYAVEGYTNMLRSRPARGAWIEISTHLALRLTKLVAPRKGRVD